MPKFELTGKTTAIVVAALLTVATGGGTYALGEVCGQLHALVSSYPRGCPPPSWQPCGEGS
jgi:hypothetical protein